MIVVMCHTTNLCHVSRNVTVIGDQSFPPYFLGDSGNIFLPIPQPVPSIIEQFLWLHYQHFCKLN